MYTPMIPSITEYATKEKLNTHINTQLNTQLNTQEIQSNSNEFDNSINLITTGDIIDVSSETIASGSALRKELTPAEIDELLSW